MKTKDQPLNLTSYHSKLVGVTFEGRQEVIDVLNGDEELRFRREPENEYDENAVAVDVKLVDAWLPIGYIARDKNAELAKILTDGKHASITLKDITGGGDKAYGVNVYIEYERERHVHRSENAVLVKDFFGNEIYYNPVAHEYTNALGEVYLSGSAYAAEEDFDADYWAKDAIVKHDLDERLVHHVKAMWNTNGEASRSFGTAVHAAIELYGSYKKLADAIDMDVKTGKRKMVSAKVEKNSALSKIPFLRTVTLNFFTPERLAEKAYYEVLVIDHKNKRAGRIDRLLLLPDGRYEIRDMKTNFKIAKKERDGYTKQLSFYADILVANGKELGDNPIMIHHLIKDDWKDIKLTKVDTL